MHVHEEMSRDLVVIPIRDGSKKTEAVYSTHDGVTVINITKPSLNRLSVLFARSFLSA